MSKWISVEDRMPPDDNGVLIHVITANSIPLITTSAFCEGNWMSDCANWLSRGNCVTHWMRLPAPPKIKELP